MSIGQRVTYSDAFSLVSLERLNAFFIFEGKLFLSVDLHSFTLNISLVV